MRYVVRSINSHYLIDLNVSAKRLEVRSAFILNKSFGKAAMFHPYTSAKRFQTAIRVYGVYGYKSRSNLLKVLLKSFNV